MKEIRLGRVLVGNRHKRGITQDELAAYLGVSKAAVSKWETGMTYPDITLLPQLAAYFNISIDELMGYEPQMDKMEIRKCYYLLAEEFSSLSFEEALEHCHEKLKKILFLLSVFISYGYFAGKSFYAGRKSGKIGADTGRGKRAFQPCKNRSRGSESWKRGASDGSVLPADPETAGRDTGAVRRGCDNNKSGRTGAGFCLSASGKCFGSGTDFADRHI